MQKAIPRYLRVYSSLKNQIEGNRYKLGELLPTEHEIGKTFNVSRTTVRKAVEMLARQGFVYVRQGKGTEIMDFKATQKLQYVSSFSETLCEQGYDIAYRNVAVRFVTASRTVAKDLKLKPKSRVVKVTRIALANKKPIALMRNYLLPDVVPDIQHKSERIGSLYRFLESEYGIIIDTATDCITAKVATPKEAELLRVSAGAPLLQVRRVTNSGGKPIEIAELWIIADKYQYTVHTKDRPPRSTYL